MNLGQIRLYDLFRRELHLTDDKAAAFVLALGEVVGLEFDTKKEVLATKGDVLAVKDDIIVLKDDIHHLELKMEQYKSETTKAIYWANIVQLVVMLSSMLAMVKFIK